MRLLLFFHFFLMFNQLPEVLALVQLAFMRLLKRRIKYRPPHDDIAGKVQPNHHGNEGSDRLVGDYAVTENHRVVGKESRQAHPKQRRKQGPGQGVTQAHLGIGDKVVQQGQRDEEHGEGHRPPQRAEDIDVLPMKVEDRLGTLEKLFPDPIGQDDQKDDNQNDNHPNEGDHPVADRVLVTGHPIGQVNAALKGSDPLTGRPKGNQGPGRQQATAPLTQEVVDEGLDEGVDRLGNGRLQVGQDRLGIEPNHWQKVPNHQDCWENRQQSIVSQGRCRTGNLGHLKVTQQQQHEFFHFTRFFRRPDPLVNIG